MKATKILLAGACLAACLLPASAHHEAASGKGAYLAFWSGHGQPEPADLVAGTCADGAYWEKGFVSIYSQGQVTKP